MWCGSGRCAGRIGTWSGAACEAGGGTPGGGVARVVFVADAVLVKRRDVCVPAVLAGAARGVDVAVGVAIVAILVVADLVRVKVRVRVRVRVRDCGLGHSFRVHRAHMCAPRSVP